MKSLFAMMSWLKKRQQPAWPEQLYREIERRYINEYLELSDTTNGPSLLSTRSDYSRLLLFATEELQYDHPEVEFWIEEIMARLEKIPLSTLRDPQA